MGPIGSAVLAFIGYRQIEKQSILSCFLILCFFLFSFLRNVVWCFQNIMDNIIISFYKEIIWYNHKYIFFNIFKENTTFFRVFYNKYLFYNLLMQTFISHAQLFSERSKRTLYYLSVVTWLTFIFKGYDRLIFMSLVHLLWFIHN